MAAPKTTIWELEAHTRAKHELLRRYLQAWMPILAQGGFPNILYIDGFAGPGRYAGGGAGTPTFALNSASGPARGTKGHILFPLLEWGTDKAPGARYRLGGVGNTYNLPVKVAAGGGD